MKKKQTPPLAGSNPAYVQQNQAPAPGSKPWYKRKRVIIPALLLLGSVGAAVQGQDKPTQAAGTTSSPATAVQALVSSTSSVPSSTVSSAAPSESSVRPATATETTTSEPVATSTTTPVQTSTRTTTTAVVRYTSCEQVRDAGAAPLREGDPGYSLELDRDGDGVACEPVAATTTNAYVAPEPTYVAPKPTPSAPLGVVGGGSSTYYANCSAVKAAGAAPIYRGQPGYSGKLDRDGDGVACER
ncbi:hypothetical protein GCM10027599_25940 [Yimella radicis]